MWSNITKLWGNKSKDVNLADLIDTNAYIKHDIDNIVSETPNNTSCFILDNNSQDWTVPKLILSIPGHIIWYPSLQPIREANAQKLKYTSLQLGEKARLFYKDQTKDTAVYISNYSIQFKK